MTLLAACRRASVLALAVVRDNVVLEVCRFRPDGAALLERVADLVRRVAADYDATALVAEPDSIVSEALAAAGIPFLATTVSEARAQLLAPTTSGLRHELYDRLLDDHPQLRPYLRLQARGCRSLVNDRSRTAPLLAVALGLGAVLRARSHNGATNCLLN